MLAGILDAILKGEEQVEISYRWSQLRNSLVFMSEMAAHAFSTGRNELAIACFRKAVILDPKNALFQHRLSELMGRTGRIEEAIRHSRQAVALGPANAAFQQRLGDLLDRAGQTQRAKDTPSLAIGAEPVQPIPNSLQQAFAQ